MSDDFEKTLHLVSAAQGGDSRALNDLFLRYLPWTRQVVALRLGRRQHECADLEDIVQESLLDAFQSLDRLDQTSEASFRHWLGRLAHNNVLDHLRRQKAKKRGGGKVKSLGELGHTTLSDSVFAGPGATPSQHAVGHELETQLEEVLLTLEERDREIIIQRRLSGLSYRDIAKELGLDNEATARSVFSRAWARFQEKLDRVRRT
ncbi:MAG: RNA polymerase sigma factor [Planctomycetota bacterium]